ncbi:MAG: transposase [Albidovulum sp.]|nr:transposase [Albidovulum sp.]
MAAAVPKHARCAAALVALRGIGDNDALLPGGELFYRDFRNRRELASMAGLVPAPWASGGIDRDQGTGKAGNSMLRKHLIQMAWRWLFHQPGSALSRRYGNCVSARDGRSRKRAIVALARKLLVAPWRCATTGLVPEGAVFSKA